MERRRALWAGSVVHVEHAWGQHEYVVSLMGRYPRLDAEFGYFGGLGAERPVEELGLAV